MARSSWRAASLNSTTVSASLIGTIDVNDKVLDRFVGHAKAWAPFGHELLSNLVFESFWSCGDLAFWGGFNSVFERDACDDFGEVVKAA